MTDVRDEGGRTTAEYRRQAGASGADPERSGGLDARQSASDVFDDQLTNQKCGVTL
ncbi:hypothetical protein [Paludibaculum fermentans]|uniref:hypothetical protein n=1 Tax=Paludibaculum fermentans TaxID=1473598 RepID=UPI003EBDD936